MRHRQGLGDEVVDHGQTGDAQPEQGKRMNGL
jgi:hypothetical protein